MNFITLTWIDYTLFILIFTLSVGVGIYFGCFGKSHQTTTDYLLGGRSMKIFPVAMSMVASTLSGISLMGVPTEIYMYGTQYSVMVLSLIFMAIGNYYIYLPVFYKLQVTSSFEYFEVRFDRKLKIVASILYTLTNLCFIPLVIYAPSLAFNQVTGFNLHIIALIMTIICVFYTSIGGLKAIIWTDTMQFSITLCTLAFVFIMGTVSVGGFANIWERAANSGRIEFFNMNPDPTARSTFWTVFLGNYFLWSFSISVGPPCVQRFLSVPSLWDAKKALGFFLVFTVLTKLISFFTGLIIYAKYYDCDPLTAGFMQKADQIVPFYVSEVAADVPGLSGLFIAGLFTTALSTLSTYLNTLSGIIYTDFIASYIKSDKSEKHASKFMQIITVLLGCISWGMIYMLKRLGSILELLVSFAGVTAGPILGLITLGMLIPFANTEGALFGAFGALSLMSVIIVNAHINVWNGRMKHTHKRLETYGCNSSFLILTTNATVTDTSEEIFWLFRISFHYYFLVGCVATFILGFIFSLITRNSKDPAVDPGLLSPFVQKWVKRRDDQNKLEDTVVFHKNNFIDKLNIEPEHDTLLKP